MRTLTTSLRAARKKPVRKLQEQAPPIGLGARLEHYKREVGSHWRWQGGLNNDGYGYVSVAGKQKRVHRVAYEHYTGETIPPRMEIDHLCRYNDCFNPDHLEIVTHDENMRRRALRDAGQMEWIA
jgi:hypothetical protein